MITRSFVHRLHGRPSLLAAALIEALRRPAPDDRRIADTETRNRIVRDRLRAKELQIATKGLAA